MATEPSYPELLSLAVHELRTPAGVIGGYLTMLQRDAKLGAKRRKIVDEASKSCARLVALIGELNDIARLDDGSAVLSAQRVDVFSLIDEVAEGMLGLPDRDAHHPHMEARGPDAGARLTGDEGRLRVALGAIFKAILREKPGPCTVVADRRFVQEGGARSALIVVAEEPAIEAACRAPVGVFDEKRGGVGLSLPVARRVITAHGGRLWSPDLPDARAARGAALIAFPLSN